MSPARRRSIGNYSQSQVSGRVSSYSSIYRTVAVGFAVASAGSAAAAPIQLTLKGRRFIPAEIVGPAGQRFVMQVHNLDPAPAEFESYDAKVEKIIVPAGSIVVNVGPLKPGSYKFFDDYNPSNTGVLRIVPMATAK